LIVLEELQFATEHIDVADKNDVNLKASRLSSVGVSGNGLLDDAVMSVREMQFDKEARHTEKYPLRFVLGRGDQETFTPDLPQRKQTQMVLGKTLSQ
jgi:hypothetical protein